MERNGKILVATILGLFVALVIWVVSTTPDAPPPIEKLEPPSTMEYEGNTITEERRGVRLFEVTSGKMVVDAQTQNAEFENISGKFYQRDGKFVEFSARRGSYNHQRGDIHIEGEISVSNSEGAKLTSEKLDWIGDEGKLIATENVQISREDTRAYADRAEATNGLRHFKLIGNARVIKGAENKKSEGTFDELEKILRDNLRDNAN